MSTAHCTDCGQLYILPLTLRRNRVLLCPGCKQERHDAQKLASQRRRAQVKRHNEPFDIPAAEIEARFTAALKEARRQSSGNLEPFRSYGWQYKEPRS